MTKIDLAMHNNNTTANIIFALLQDLPQDQTQIFCTILWSLWKSRNMRVWQNITETCQTVVERARHLLFGWRVANGSKQMCGMTRNDAGMQTVEHVAAASTIPMLPVQVSWQKPASGRLKCNVDASFSEALNCVGFGLCIRDENGNFIKAKTLWSNPVCATDIGEVLGLSHAIHWVRDLQLMNVDFELDAKQVVDYFNGGYDAFSEFGAIIEDCRRRCQAHFLNSKVEFSLRQANGVAHTLA